MPPASLPPLKDPRIQRFQAIETYNYTTFDVPYLSPVTPTLWFGGCHNELLLPPDIEHLVNLTGFYRYAVEHSLQSSLSFPLHDDELGFDADLIQGLGAWVNRCRSRGPTCVHCQAGINRSALVVATALILEGATPAAAVELLRSCRSPSVLSNPSYVTWLQALPALIAEKSPLPT